MLSEEKENQLQELQKHCASLNGEPWFCPFMDDQCLPFGMRVQSKVKQV
jgi:hypothetical protein